MRNNVTRKRTFVLDTGAAISVESEPWVTLAAITSHGVHTDLSTQISAV